MVASLAAPTETVEPYIAQSTSSKSASASTSTFTHILPTDTSLNGEAFFRALQEAGQIRSYDSHRFYCACRPVGWATSKGRQEGTLHWQGGKAFQKARWTGHVRSAEARD